jgi:hypothetical protein
MYFVAMRFERQKHQANGGTVTLEGDVKALGLRFDWDIVLLQASFGFDSSPIAVDNPVHKRGHVIKTSLSFNRLC